MMEDSLGLIVEGLVCVLLVASIYYSITVNRKLERLRKEQKGMQSFIRELLAATSNADKAIQGLRQTVEASGQELAGQIEKGRNMSRQLQGEIEQAEQSMNRLVVLAGSAAAPHRQQAQHALAQPPQDQPQGGGRSVEELRRAMLGFDDLEMDAGPDAQAEARLDEELLAAGDVAPPRGGKLTR